MNKNQEHNGLKNRKIAKKLLNKYDKFSGELGVLMYEYEAIDEITKLIAKQKESLFDFFMWFRENGEKHLNNSIEKMIDIYLEEKNIQI